MRAEIKTKALSLASAVVIAATSFMPAFAAPVQNPISVRTPEAGQAYEAYQIIKGDRAIDEQTGEVILSNMVWGDGIDPVAFIDNFKQIESIKSNEEVQKLTGTPEGDKTTSKPADVFNALAKAKESKISSDQKQADKDMARVAGEALTTVATPLTAATEKDSEGFYVHTATLDDGYYLIKDKTRAQGEEDPKAFTEYILQVTGATDINVKAEWPSIDKKVYDDASGDFQDYTDANIGDVVTFKVDVQIPSNIAEYTNYTLKFTDTFSKGLTFVDDSIRLNASARMYDIVITPATDGTSTLTFTIEPNYNLAGQTLSIFYAAKVNADAVIGKEGNPNKVYLEYSNNPYNEDDFGKTPEEEAVVFVYELDTLKSDGTDPVKDAEFRMFRYVYAEREIQESQVQESQIPEVHVEGMDKQDAAKTRIFVNPDEFSKMVADGIIEEQQDGRFIGKQYLIVDADNKVSAWTFNEAEASKLISGENGLIPVKGLKSGVYYLEETKAPAGYNLLEAPVEIVINNNLEKMYELYNGRTPADTSDILTATQDDQQLQTNADTGIINAEIVNVRGTILPTTGGMGTTLIYVAGGVFVLAAIAVLAMRKKNN